MDCLHMNGSCSTKHPSSGFIEDYLLNLILEWFWSRICLATIRCFKKSKGLDMQYSKDSKAFTGPYIQYIWLLKRCPVVGKCLCLYLEKLRTPVQVHKPVLLCISNNVVGCSRSSGVRTTSLLHTGMSLKARKNRRTDGGLSPASFILSPCCFC